jgi:hypothetical protein
MSVLSDEGVYSLRVYALLDEDTEGQREAITARVNSDLGNLWIEH